LSNNLGVFITSYYNHANTFMMSHRRTTAAGSWIRRYLDIRHQRVGWDPANTHTWPVPDP